MEPIKSKFSIQDHWQKRTRRSHFDIRILAPSRMKLWSWALPNLKFPGEKERVLAIRTSDHKVSYIHFDGKLKNGDIVKLYDKGECVIYKITTDMMIFKLLGDKINGTFIFIRIHTSKDAWIIIRSKGKANEP